MAKKPVFSPRVTPAPENQSINYAFKPRLIGAVIKDLMEQQKKDPAGLGQFMKITKRTAQRWLEIEFLPIPRLMKLSEWLGEDLLRRYRSNVKPLLEEAIKLHEQKLADAAKQIAELQNTITIQQNHIARLEAQQEVYKELEQNRNGK